MRDLTFLVIINILTLICSIPIVTAGAAVTSMHYILFQMVDDKEGHIVRSFFRQFRVNIKSATPIWLIMLLASAALYYEYSVFSGMEGGRIISILVYVGVLFLSMIGVWVFPLSAKFVYTIGACFQNAFILCITKLLRTIGMVVIMSVIPFVLTHDIHLAPLAFLFGLSLPGYFCALIYHPILDEMIKKTQPGTVSESDSSET